ncbi:Glyco-hydro-79C domain-containing protein [Mycena indigotica]|uniref:Glyco-hydro-79C domain-containing protein n=1 Tax=Mycena indigotica TaxID=2126181 RepID=A0A8H6TAG0_9AGAR|nr:Glyco-hydro-79C domain-containing protein [Mycena indigotica]KAF7315155.1 Glyco-hydro-79C domain-containing protein [Mycena indigotica]
MGPLRQALLLALSAHNALGEITVYHAQRPMTTGVGSAGLPTHTGLPAYDPTTLNPPPIPNDIMKTIPVNLLNSGTAGLSIKQKGSFMGFSVEMSVTNQVLGKNSTHIQVPFLNLMANLQQRAGSVMVRVGGNTQESAKMVDSLPDGRILMKDLENVTGTTQTPPLDYTTDLLYLMRNVSSFVNVHWFLGIPWLKTKPFDTAIVTAADLIIGDYLLGLQASNEPDMYVIHGHRPETYGPFDYLGELSDFLGQVTSTNADPTGRAMKNLIGPNIATFAWTLEQVWDTGFVDTYNANLAYLAAEKYPNHNCNARFGDITKAINPQNELANYLVHSRHKALLAEYLNTTTYLQTKNKPFLMFETNTASCGGFLGISDAFVSALWGIDYALQMAYSNFSGAMFHLGGQSVYYNASFSASYISLSDSLFSPSQLRRQTRALSINGRLVLCIYYSALIMAEAMGPSNNSQVLDLPIEGLSDSTPVYAIYENGVPKRVAIVNYVNDPSHANDISVVISLANQDGTKTTPASVKVKYLAAASVVQKGNITWAGQTFGGNFESDGRPMGQEDIKTVTCDGNAKTCTVVVPAPGFALVFLSDDAMTEDKGLPSTTFATTAKTKFRNTVTVDPAVLATSNGNKFADHELAGTSRPPSAASRTAGVSVAVVTLLLGWVVALTL